MTSPPKINLAADLLAARTRLQIQAITFCALEELAQASPVYGAPGSWCARDRFPSTNAQGFSGGGIPNPQRRVGFRDRNECYSLQILRCKSWVPVWMDSAASSQRCWRSASGRTLGMAGPAGATRKTTKVRIGPRLVPGRGLKLLTIRAPEQIGQTKLLVNATCRKPRLRISAIPSRGVSRTFPSHHARDRQKHRAANATVYRKIRDLSLVARTECDNH